MINYTIDKIKYKICCFKTKVKRWIKILFQSKVNIEQIWHNKTIAAYVRVTMERFDHGPLYSC